MREAMTSLSGRIPRHYHLLLLGIALLLAVAAVPAYFFLDEWVLGLSRYGSLVPSSVASRFVRMLGKAWMLVWLLLVWFLARAQHRRTVLAGFLALILTIPLVHPVKACVRRPRPYAVIRAQTHPGAQIEFHEYLSFPSADTAAICAVVAVTLPALAWPLWCGMVPLAALVAGLRVAQRAHYPSDVLVGAALGILAGWLSLRILRHEVVCQRICFGHERFVAGLGVVAIPLFVGLCDSWSDLLFLLTTYGVAILLMLVGCRLIQNTHRRPRLPGGVHTHWP